MKPKKYEAQNGQTGTDIMECGEKSQMIRVYFALIPHQGGQLGHVLLSLLLN